METSPTQPARTGLRRELGVLALTATAVCTVIGGGINVLTLHIQQDVPGIGPLVPLAFAAGAIPAVLTALAYAVLGSAMPRAGGGYMYASRALHPFVGFIATFSKWFGLAAACGAIAYVDVSLLKAAVLYAGLDGAARFLEGTFARLAIPLFMIWLFWLVNLLGVRTYGWTVIILMVFMLAGGLVVMFVGMTSTPNAFAEAVGRSELAAVAGQVTHGVGGLWQVIRAVSILFFAYIGFATISQAGGEARVPSRSLPRAFVAATAVITAYYVLFSGAVYHAVPWRYVAGLVAGAGQEISVPELLGALMPPALAVFVALMAAVALANDIPPILMAVSRLFFSWANDGIFPRGLAAVNRRFGTPHWALTLSAAIASLIVLQCYRDGFLFGVNVVNNALLLTYLLVAASVLTFPRRNPALYRRVAFIRNRGAQIAVALLSMLTVGALLAVRLRDDVLALQAGGNPLDVPGVSWLFVLAVGAVVFALTSGIQKSQGRDLSRVFATLPHETEEPEGPEVE